MADTSSNGLDIVDRTFEFGVRVKRLCAYLRANVRAERHLASQLERAGTAVGANVEEAQGAESRKDFIHKMSIAQKEAREANYWLRQLGKSGTLPQSRIADLTDEAHQLKLILAAIINSTRRNMEDKGAHNASGEPQDTSQTDE
jgi:four helix bundle protein